MKRINKTKALSFILASALTVSMLAGCGKKVVTDPKPVTNGDSVVKEEENPLKFTFAMTTAGNDYAMKIQDTKEEKWVKAFNERFNMDMDLMLFDHKKLQENMQIMFASGNIPDILECYDNYNRPEMAGSVQAGMFMPLDELLEKNKDKLPNLMASIPENAWEMMKYEGKIYGIPSVYLSLTSRRATYIRKDLLDKYELEIPKTQDEMVAVLEVFKENGVKYPYSGRDLWDYTDVFFGSHGVDKTTWNLNEEGKLIPDMITDEMGEALAFHAKLREDGLMDPESITNNSSVWLSKISAGDVGLFNYNANLLESMNSQLQGNVPDAEFVLIPSPIGEGGPGGNSGMFRYAPVSQTIYINKDFKDAERFLFVLEEMASEESQEFFSLGIEGEDYTKVDGKIQYEYPTDPDKVNENIFRRNLALVRDESYNKYTLPFAPGGEELTNWFENVGPNEGLTSYNPGALQSLVEHPELKPNKCDLFYDYSARIFLGETTVEESWKQFQEDYLKFGGDKVIEEATEAYNNDTGFWQK